jgi:hypothetical protein
MVKTVETTCLPERKRNKPILGSYFSKHSHKPLSIGFTPGLLLVWQSSGRSGVLSVINLAKCACRLLTPLERHVVMCLLWLEAPIPVERLSAWVTKDGKK